jgi:hypothetical protein
LQSIQPEEVEHMIFDNSPVARMYGAIAAKRLCEKNPELLHMAVDIPDEDVRRFALEDA